jgi:hypothetical protein
MRKPATLTALFLAVAALSLSQATPAQAQAQAQAKAKTKTAEKAPVGKEPKLADVPQKTRDFCHSYGEKKNEIVLLLIDRTTEFKPNSATAEKIRAATDRALDLLKPQQRLVVHNLSNDPNKRAKLFDSCRPGMEKSIFKAPLSPDETRKLDNSKEDFTQHLRQQIEAEIAYPRKDSPSAIVDTLVFQTRLGKDEKIAGLVIASDMIDNHILGMKSPFPPIGERQRFEMVDKLASAGQLAKLELDTTVHIFGFGVIDEPDRTQLNLDTRDSYEKFWREFFARSRTKVPPKFE